MRVFSGVLHGCNACARYPSHALAGGLRLQQKLLLRYFFQRLIGMPARRAAADEWRAGLGMFIGFIVRPRPIW